MRGIAHADCTEKSSGLPAVTVVSGQLLVQAATCAVSLCCCTNLCTAVLMHVLLCFCTCLSTAAAMLVPSCHAAPKLYLYAWCGVTYAEQKPGVGPADNNDYIATIDVRSTAPITFQLVQATSPSMSYQADALCFRL